MSGTIVCGHADNGRGALVNRIVPERTIEGRYVASTGADGLRGIAHIGRWTAA